MYFYTNIIYFSFDFFFFTYSDDEEEKVNGVYYVWRNIKKEKNQEKMIFY